MTYTYSLVALGWRLHTFPLLCEFNDNETLASYGNGIYVERIEEHIAFKDTYEIKSLFEKYEDCDDDVYWSEHFAILIVFLW